MPFLPEQPALTHLAERTQKPVGIMAHCLDATNPPRDLMVRDWLVAGRTYVVHEIVDPSATGCALILLDERGRRMEMARGLPGFPSRRFRLHFYPQN